MAALLNPSLFNISVKDGFRLITPTHAGAVANAPWTKDTLHYRSLIETLDEKIVSIGAKKFFNLGMGPEGLSITADHVAAAVSLGEIGDVIATTKIDGSLLIRSVYNGKVILRTRGSFGYEHLANSHEVEEIFKADYPKLWDPTLYPEDSLLFEWVSPENVIVLKYEDPALTLIGGINHGDLTYLRMTELKVVSADLGIPLVPYFNLSSRWGFEQLLKSMYTRQDIEGYVIRLNGEQDWVKIKATSYLTKHALKSTLTTEGLADLYFEWVEPSFLTFAFKFKKAYDEETYLWALGAISCLYDGIAEWRKMLSHMQQNATSRVGWTRKDAATKGLEEYGKTKKFSAYMHFWEKRALEQDLKKSLLLQVTKQFELEMFDRNDGGEGYKESKDDTQRSTGDA